MVILKEVEKNLTVSEILDGPGARLVRSSGASGADRKT
jgi:hypothetical protein